MNLKDLEEKLAVLQSRLKDHQADAMDAITAKRIGADMGDDYRENEGAKLVMEQHDMWYIRKVALKKEIAQLRLQIARLKKV